MKSNIFISLIVFCFCFFCNAEAQSIVIHPDLLQRVAENTADKQAWLLLYNNSLDTIQSNRKKVFRIRKTFLFFNNHPAVKPGSEIFVPTKPEPKGNTTQEILGYTTGLASLGAIILGILSLKK